MLQTIKSLTLITFYDIYTIILCLIFAHRHHSTNIQLPQFEKVGKILKQACYDLIAGPGPKNHSYFSKTPLRFLRIRSRQVRFAAGLLLCARTPIKMKLKNRPLQCIQISWILSLRRRVIDLGIPSRWSYQYNLFKFNNSENGLLSTPWSKYEFVVKKIKPH